MRSYRHSHKQKLDISETKPGFFIITGDLTFATLDKAALEHGKKLFSATDITVDLQQVGKTDSAGLALMIEWLKLSKQQGTKLHLLNIPLQLQALAKLSGFEHYLQLL